jgi:hypothetical protein
MASAATTKESISADIAECSGRVQEFAAMIPHLATKTEFAECGVLIHKVETSIIRWTVGTGIAVVALVFTIMRYAH